MKYFIALGVGNLSWEELSEERTSPMNGEAVTIFCRRVSNGIVSFPFAGMIQIRFQGFFLSPHNKCGHP
jgi:hypothetical protein